MYVFVNIVILKKFIDRQINPHIICIREICMQIGCMFLLYFCFGFLFRNSSTGISSPANTS